VTDPTDHDELRTLADKLDDIAQRAEEEHISGVRPALRKWDTDRLHAAADVLRDDLQRRQRAYLATKRLTAERDAERAARERAEAEARQLREAIRAHENLHRPDGPDGADGPIEMDGWPCCNDDRLLWAAAVAEVAEDRGQTDG
jgi:hypothetical protein